MARCTSSSGASSAPTTSRCRARGDAARSSLAAAAAVPSTPSASSGSAQTRIAEDHGHSPSLPRERHPGAARADRVGQAAHRRRRRDGIGQDRHLRPRRRRHRRAAGSSCWSWLTGASSSSRPTRSSCTPGSTSTRSASSWRPMRAGARRRPCRSRASTRCDTARSLRPTSSSSTRRTASSRAPTARCARTTPTPCTSASPRRPIAPTTEVWGSSTRTCSSWRPSASSSTRATSSSLGCSRCPRSACRTSPASACAQATTPRTNSTKRSTKRTLVGDIVEHWLRHAGGVRTVAFAVSVKHSRHIAERFREGGIAAEHLDGTTPTPERDAILARIERGETRVVSSLWRALAKAGISRRSSAPSWRARPSRRASTSSRQGGSCVPGRASAPSSSTTPAARASTACRRTSVSSRSSPAEAKARRADRCAHSRLRRLPGSAAGADPRLPRVRPALRGATPNADGGGRRARRGHAARGAPRRREPQAQGARRLGPHAAAHLFRADARAREGPEEGRELGRRALRRAATALPRRPNGSTSAWGSL